ncbi:MAG: hypothetical protein IIB43_09390 [Candidatus Marinimicrobia bacterium]|nr:hypothetical protein [Candidatus Neomarinimicrobiota bacterium]
MPPPDGKQCGFSHDHYRHCLEKALGLGYRFATMGEYVDGVAAEGKIILMRHDEDFSPEAAKALADMEADLGVRSTYFFRYHARQYNLLSLANMALLQQLRGQGHEIGLHGETHALPALRDQASELLKRERELLTLLVGVEVTGLSRHEPARTGSSASDKVPPGFKYEAYSDQFSGLKYISDSSAHWREGCMCQHIGEVDRLYILTHGFWWYRQTPLENY